MDTPKEGNTESGTPDVEGFLEFSDDDKEPSIEPKKCTPVIVPPPTKVAPKSNIHPINKLPTCNFRPKSKRTKGAPKISTNIGRFTVSEPGASKVDETPTVEVSSRGRPVTRVDYARLNDGQLFYNPMGIYSDESDDESSSD